MFDVYATRLYILYKHNGKFICECHREKKYIIHINMYIYVLLLYVSRYN